MELKTAIFYVLSTILVASSLRVITAKNPVHAVLFLVLGFFSAGGLWLLLQAEFLAIVLVVVYVGAVMVLFLFVVMMLHIDIERLREGFWSHMPVAVGVGVMMVFEMALVLTGRYFSPESLPEPAAAGPGYSNTKELGRLLFSDYVYPFELASVILLVAIIAAVVLTKREAKDKKEQNIRKQIAVRRNDRVRIVAMPSEKE